ncbi:MAG: sugar phosphate isomerase/epimerase [Planctomycetes bacterium]|nr:sugar phosphate isomerase/epimerase [Planctomycetota bacterium]
MIDPARRALLRSALAGAVIGAGLSARARGQEAAAAAPKPTRPALRKALKYGMIQVKGEIQDRFALAKQCGFEGVEIDSPLEIDRAAVVAASQATGVVVHGVIDSVHWQERFSDPRAEVRERAVAALRTAIGDARTYGATTVLVVPGAVRHPEHENYEQVWKRSQAEIAKCVPDAKAAGVRIAIEVVWNDFIKTPEELVRYVDEFADPAVGAYFDCSNMVKYGPPPADWIRRLGSRLLKVDFKGYSKTRGWVPIGEGDEDWPAVLEALAHVGYSGWFTAEVEGGGHDHLLDVSRRMDAILGRS